MAKTKPTKKTPKKVTTLKQPWYKKTTPLVALLIFAVVGTILVSLSFAARGGNGGGGGGHGGGGKPTKGGSGSTSNITSESELRDLHATLCPQVSQYTDCSTLRVVIGYYDTAWVGSSHPADNYVEYNSKYLNRPVSSWSVTIAHEVGGHIDTWNELVSKVGLSRAWTDYYDIDTYAEPFFETKLGTDLSSSRAKEVYLDCQGAVRNGYMGDYLRGYYGKTTLSAQQDTCKSYRTIFDQAIAS